MIKHNKKPVKKILTTAMFAVGLGMGVSRTVRCISRIVAKNVLKAYADALDNGAVLTLTLKAPEKRCPMHRHAHPEE